MLQVQIGQGTTNLTPACSIISSFETKPYLCIHVDLVWWPYICVKAWRRIKELEEQETFLLIPRLRALPPWISQEKSSKGDTLQRLLKHSVANTQHLATAARQPQAWEAACCSQADALYASPSYLSLQMGHFPGGPGQTLLINHDLNLSQWGDLRLDIIWKQIGWKIALTIGVHTEFPCESFRGVKTVSSKTLNDLSVREWHSNPVLCHMQLETVAASSSLLLLLCFQLSRPS